MIRLIYQRGSTVEYGPRPKVEYYGWVFDLTRRFVLKRSGTVRMFDARERHYKVIELATAWGIHPCTIRRIFSAEPGVLKIQNPRKRVRTYAVLRIPESIAQKVYERLTSADAR